LPYSSGLGLTSAQAVAAAEAAEAAAAAVSSRASARRAWEARLRQLDLEREIASAEAKAERLLLRAAGGGEWL